MQRSSELRRVSTAGFSFETNVRWDGRAFHVLAHLLPFLALCRGGKIRVRVYGSCPTAIGALPCRGSIARLTGGRVSHNDSRANTRQWWLASPRCFRARASHIAPVPLRIPGSAPRAEEFTENKQIDNSGPGSFQGDCGELLMIRDFVNNVDGPKCGNPFGDTRADASPRGGPVDYRRLVKN